jgi:hypothetical protein
MEEVRNHYNSKSNWNPRDRSDLITEEEAIQIALKCASNISLNSDLLLINYSTGHVRIQN